MARTENERGVLKKSWIDVLELPDGTPVRIPVITVHGSADGPKLVITAAIHGWEIVGTEVVRRVVRDEIDPKQLHGTVVAVPVANPLAFQVRAYITPHDNVDVSSAMPGEASGTQSRRIAEKLWRLIEWSSCYIDLHCMEGPSVPLTIVRGPDNGLVINDALKIARAFGLPIARPSQETLRRRPNTAADLALANSVPAIIPELPFPSIFMQDSSIEIGVRGVLNVMRALKMIPGELEKQNIEFQFAEPIHTMMISANRGGIVHPVSKLGAAVKKGDPIVRIVDVFGEEAEVVRAPRDGYVISFPLNINQIAGSGDFVALLGFT